MQCLLAIPVGVNMLRDEPAIFYPRMHGGPYFEFFNGTWVQENILVEANDRGFVSSISEPVGVTWPVSFGSYDEERDKRYFVIIASSFGDWEDEWFSAHDYTLAISPEYIFYSDATAMLAVPTHLVGAQALEDMDLRELFNTLALYNRYFTSILAPAFAVTTLVHLATQVLIMAAAVLLFGQWQKLSGNMSIRERFSVCTFASVPANAIGFLIGFVLPMHVFIAQLIMIYVAYKAMKEYWNE